MADVEFDHFPEIADNGKATRRLELLGIKEDLSEPIMRRKFFASLEDEDFQKMAGYINSVTRGQKIENNYGNGTLPFTKTPPSEDKKKLMDMTMQTVREICTDPDMDDKTALRRAGLTFAGAINYIHPYDNGNGRTSRIMQYLTEFGTERSSAFDNELYAVIGKLPVYETDHSTSIRNTPLVELTHALGVSTQNQDPEAFSKMGDGEFASARVATFLNMMKGRTKVPIIDEVVRSDYDFATRKVSRPVRMGANSIDGLALYMRDYLTTSSIPNRKPDDVPQGAKRVVGEKPKEKLEGIIITADVVS